MRTIGRCGKILGMKFKPAIWRPIAIVLSLINVVAAGFAAQAAESWHAGIHAALALAFGLWSERLRVRLQAAPAIEAGDRLEALETEINTLRQELNEAQERLDFAERLLSQGQESRRVEPER